jgi:hypothetical protein
MEGLNRGSLERIIELSANMENLVQQVNLMDKKLDEIRTDHVATTSSNIAVLQSKISRLEAIIYGTAGLAFIEGITLLVTLIVRQ